jgi:hypothetical protein
MAHALDCTVTVIGYVHPKHPILCHFSVASLTSSPSQSPSQLQFLCACNCCSRATNHTTGFTILLRLRLQVAMGDKQHSSPCDSWAESPFFIIVLVGTKAAFAAWRTDLS